MDILRFLVTTDNHLGYMERDPRRGPDSFISFEECLRAGRVEHDCDAVLLGGDLFHDNKPSLGTLHRTLALFRTYTMGDRPVEFALASDPAVNFPTHPLPVANFQDPNLNVAMPAFMIHGNHDDPAGGTSSIDTLAAAGLVNYFGHAPDLDHIVVRPVLLCKGATKVALYGLGNVRDERFHRCLKLGKVQFVRPKEDAAEWFSILVLHQNRGVRGGAGSKGGIPEEMLCGFGFDLVIWGNEHEQLMVPAACSSGEFDVVQPGSTVMTSLGAGESNPKQYGILEVSGTTYRITPHSLKSVRPVVRRHVELHREGVAKASDDVDRFLRSVTEGMLEEADALVQRIPDSVLRVHPNVKYPLLRLAVDFHDPAGAAFPQPHTQRFGQQFLEVVVNPNDMLKPLKPPPAARTTVGQGQTHDQGQDQGTQPVTTDDIRSKIAAVFSANAKDACTLLSEPEVSAAVHTFVAKEERDAVGDKIDALLLDCQKAIWKQVRDQASHELSSAKVGSLAQDHKVKVNRSYFDTNPEDRPEARLPLPAPAPAVDVEAFGAGRSAVKSTTALGAVALGAPLPPSSTRLPPQDDDALPDPGVAPGRLAAQVAIDVDDDDDGPAPAPKPAAKKGRAKRTRAEGEEAEPKPAPKGRKAAPKKAAAAPAPQLQLTATASAAANILGQWK